MKPKIPTLAQLRKLAEKKGRTLVKNGGRLDCYFTKDGVSGISCCAHYEEGDCWSGLTRMQAYRCLFAALSALPDADPKRSKR